MFIAQVLVRPSKQLRQIIQIKHNIVKNPNWPEANELAIYKRGRGFELGATEKQIQSTLQSTMHGAVKCQVINVTGKLNLPGSCQQVQNLLNLHTVAFTVNIGYFAQQTKLRNQNCLLHQGCTVYRN